MTNVPNDFDDAGKDVDYTKTEVQNISKFWWSHGKRVNAKTLIPGRFYTSDRMFMDAPKGWSESDMYTEKGWEISSVRILPLLKRTQAYTLSEDGKTKIWHPHFKKDAGMSLYTELLCWLDGHTEPVIMTSKGFAATRMTAAKQSVLADHKKLIIDRANETASPALAPWAFWCELGGAFDGDKPVFIEVGKTVKISLHDIVLYRTHAENIKEDKRRAADTYLVTAQRSELLALFVGKPLYKQVTEIREEFLAKGWDKEQRKNLGEEDMFNEPAAPAQAPAQPRNVPAPMSDASVFDEDGF